MNRFCTRMARLGSILILAMLVLAACAVQTVPTVPAAPTAPAAADTAVPPAVTPATATATVAAAVADVATATTAPETAIGPTTGTPETTALACTPGQLTPAETEGPYYKTNPPEESMLLNPALSGTPLTVSGYVLDANCKPLAGVRVDFWQADAAGQYDNAGYTLRGYQLTDEQGRYRVVTVVPGLYPGRTRHIHVKVTPPNGATLTTQLYFPDVAQNSTDPIFDAHNLLTVQTDADGAETATFNFVVNG